MRRGAPARTGPADAHGRTSATEGKTGLGSCRLGEEEGATADRLLPCAGNPFDLFEVLLDVLPGIDLLSAAQEGQGLGVLAVIDQ